MRTRIKYKNRLLKQFKKDYASMIIVGLIMASALYSGFYIGTLTETIVVATMNNPILDDKQSRILSDLMDQTVGSCYYDTYQNNDSFAGSADSCDKSMMFFKQLCKTKNLDACHGDFFRKYLARMGE